MIYAANIYNCKHRLKAVTYSWLEAKAHRALTAHIHSIHTEPADGNIQLPLTVSESAVTHTQHCICPGHSATTVCGTFETASSDAAAHCRAPYWKNELRYRPR